MTDNVVPTTRQLLGENPPTNWGRWGAANEVTYDPISGVALPLHCALMRNLGVALTEIAWLDDLAAACASDNRWSFLYVAAPLKIVGGTGAPVNPIAIR